LAFISTTRHAKLILKLKNESDRLKMKVSGRETDSLLRRLDPAIRAVLIYGPNEGLVRERAAIIARQIVDDLSDPFRVAPLDASALKAEPGLLADEAAAIAMTGGRRLVKVESAGDAVTPAVDIFLKNPVGDSLVIITAEELPTRSSLRKLFEAATNALALACYEDDQASTGDLIDEVLRRHKLRAEADAVAYLKAHLGGDRAVARGELEKLAIYMAIPGEETGQIFVTRDDVMACIGDNAEMTIDEIATAATGGDLVRLDKVLFKAFNTGENPIPILRAVARRVMRLHLVSGLVSQGMPADQAIKTLQPPVFFKDAAPFKAHLSRWTTRRLAQALELLTSAERDCKTTGLPAESICARACLKIANAARPQGR
jgi:DNA polymerase-3 subunit delta